MSGKSGSSNKAIFHEIMMNPVNIKHLMECFFHENTRIGQRSAIVVGNIAKANANIVYPYIPKMLKLMTNTNAPVALRRNIVRTWNCVDIPDKYAGQIFELCFNFICDSKETIAIRAFSMSICVKTCKVYHELKNELIDIIGLHVEFGSSGIKSAANRALKELKNMK